MQSIEKVTVQSASKAPRRASGFTLVEVMIATGLLVMVAMCLLSVFIGSYRVAAKARYKDHARYIIKSFADQFLTQQSTDLHGTPYTLFTPTVDGSGNATPLGTGLNWTNTDGSTGSLSTDALGLYYYVLLGDNTGSPITATVTRQVWYLYPNTGNTTLVSQTLAAGYLLEGDFVISYQYLGATITQKIIAVRAVP